MILAILLLLVSFLYVLVLHGIVVYWTLWIAWQELRRYSDTLFDAPIVYAPYMPLFLEDVEEDSQ